MISCYICGSKQVKFFHKVRVYSYYICNKCKLLFLYPKPKSKELASHYKKQFEYIVTYEQQEIVKKRAKHILNNLLRLNSNGSRLLDVGSGYGYFLNEAKKHNLDIVGIEPSENLYSLSIKKFNLPIQNLDFQTYLKKNHNLKFDFITLIHTIEHIDEPQQFLKNVSNLLNKNGILYIETPNLDSHLFYSEKFKYTFLTPPGHLWIFSIKSLSNLISGINNLKIKKFSTYSFPEHFMAIIKKIFKRSQPKKNADKKIIEIIQVKTPPNTPIKKLKFLLFDCFLARYLNPLLNLSDKGSILELYINKK